MLLDGTGTYLSVDELQVLRALSITVAGAVLGACLVVWVLGKSTIGVHGDEVEGTVQATGQVGHIDVKGELLVLELEHLVLGVSRVHEVDPDRISDGMTHNMCSTYLEPTLDPVFKTSLREFPEVVMP